MNDLSRRTPNNVGKLQQFAIITAYSMAVLFVMGYVPGSEKVFGLGL